MFRMGRLLICALVGLCATAGAVFAAAPEPAAPAKADRRDRIVCRRFIRTGSLVVGYRTCKSQAEWDREHENLQHLEVINSCP